MQAQVDAGTWFEDKPDGFGLNARLREWGQTPAQLLNHQFAHHNDFNECDIPSIVANNVKQFAEFGPKSSLETFASIQNVAIAGQSSVGEAADAARTGRETVPVKAAENQGCIVYPRRHRRWPRTRCSTSTLLITALEDYLQKASESKSGVPIDFLLKEITKVMLAEMWVAICFPGKYTAIRDDDTEPTKKSAIWPLRPLRPLQPILER